MDVSGPMFAPLKEYAHGRPPGGVHGCLGFMRREVKCFQPAVLSPVDEELERSTASGLQLNLMIVGVASEEPEGGLIAALVEPSLLRSGTTRCLNLQCFFVFLFIFVNSLEVSNNEHQHPTTYHVTAFPVARNWRRKLSSPPCAVVPQVHWLLFKLSWFRFSSPCCSEMGAFQRLSLFKLSSKNNRVVS